MTGKIPHPQYQGDSRSWSRATVLSVVMVLPLFWPCSTPAEDAMNLELKGTLVEPPACTLNGDKPLYVSFGDSIGIRKVADGVYRQPVEPGLECDDSSLAWQMTLTLTGIAADFDPEKATVVSAEQTNLGVKLYADGVPFTLDTPLKVNGQTLPQIEAVLVKREDAALDDGKFTATATLRVAFN